LKTNGQIDRLRDTLLHITDLTSIASTAGLILRELSVLAAIGRSHGKLGRFTDIQLR